MQELPPAAAAAPAAAERTSMFDSNGGDDDVDIGTDAAIFTALLPSCWQPCAVTALTRTLRRSTLQPAARRLSLKIGVFFHVSFLGDIQALLMQASLRTADQSKKQQPKKQQQKPKTASTCRDTATSNHVTHCTPIEWGEEAEEGVISGADSSDDEGAGVSDEKAEEMLQRYRQTPLAATVAMMMMMMMVMIMTMVVVVVAAMTAAMTMSMIGFAQVYCTTRPSAVQRLERRRRRHRGGSSGARRRLARGVRRRR